MKDPRLLALRQQIESAFAEVLYPGDDRIAYSNIDQDGASLAATFRGKHWKELTPHELHHHEMTFLSREGLQFYLPAYLLASMEGYDGTLYEDIRPFTVYGLTLPDEDTPRNRHLRESRLRDFELFTPAQKRVIRSFLEYARNAWTNDLPGGESPGKALERYWGRDWQ
ncbi:DUF6714 family protein [Archangium gephyra]|uniref:DUF6714 family protein n=1 Tax=Archangium gephyra TaxID=48 RepID=UPI003B811307